MTTTDNQIYALQWIDNRDGEVKNHGLFKSFDDAYGSIYAWWKLNNFKPHYVRHWEATPGRITVDYGSHYLFYIITKVDQTNYAEVMFGHMLKEKGDN